MSIPVRCFATLAPHAPPEGAIPFRSGLSVGELLDELGIAREAARMVFVNGRRATPDAVLADNDQVGIFPAVAGG